MAGLGDVWNLLVKISGDGQSLRDDVAEDKAALDDLNATHLDDKTAKVNVDIADAIEKLDEVKTSIETLPEEKTVRINVVDNGGNNVANQGGDGAGLLGATIMTALPLISPLAASAAGALGELASAFTAAGIGAAAFGVVVAEVMKHADTQTKTMEEDINANLRNWSMSFASLVKAGLASVEGVVNTLMVYMTPVVQAAGTAIDQLLASLNKDMNTTGMAKFFQDLAQTTGPAILAFGTSAGNIFKGLAGIFEAFVPFLGNFEQGLVKITASFAQWGQQLGNSNGFKKFMDYFQQEGPKVLQTIGDLATLVVKLIETMAPLGSAILNVVDIIAKMLNAILGANLGIGQLAAAIAVGVGVFKLFSPAVSALGAVLEGSIPIFEAVGSAVIAMASEMGISITAAAGPVGILVAVIAAAAIEIVAHWNSISQFLQQAATDWAQIFDSLGQGLDNVWASIVGAAQNAWNGVLSSTRSAIQGIHEGVNNAIKAVEELGQFFSNLASEAEQWGENLLNSFTSGIRKGIAAVGNAVRDVSTTIEDFIGFHSPSRKGPGASADKWAPNLMNMMIQGVQQNAPRLQAALSKVMVPTNVSSMMQQAGQTFANSAGMPMGGHTIQLVMQGNVYGVDDFNSMVKNAVEQHAVPALVNQLKPTARAMGVSS